MSTDTLSLDFGETFRTWQADEESLAVEWNESLAALIAYQSHLDAWQQELARERDELTGERVALQREQEELHDLHKLSGESTEQAAVQLTEAREKIATLTQQLLGRTEELRKLDQQRAELSTELESARANAKELTNNIDEQKRAIDRERSAWSEEFRHLRELLDGRPEGPPAEPVGNHHEDRKTENDTSSTSPRPAAEAAPKRSSNSPVLGSIVEQFGKLRQQRAIDRQTGKQAKGYT